MTINFIISILIIVIGTLIIVAQLLLLIKARISKDWKELKGEILSSEIETLNITNENNKTYRAAISYKYSISGKQYISSRVFFGDRIHSSFKGKSLKLINKYPVGSIVSVYYDPSNLEESVLEKGVTQSILILLIIGISVILFGVILMKFYST
jgi:hypothetical protein